MAATGAGALGCTVLAVPTARFLVSPATGGASAGHWIKTLPLEGLAEGQPKRVELVADRRDAWTLERDVVLGAAWLLRVGPGSDVRAWSVVCPHLGCAILARAATFTCPCHDSAFDSQGRRLSGPSPRDLDSLDTRVEDGFVFVDFRRFRQGTPEKLAIG